MRCILILFSILIYSSGSGQRKSIQADSKIRQVIVFVQGAQIERISRLSIPAGRSEIIFSNISPMLEKQSIQVKCDQDITVLSVNQQANFLKDQETREELTNLEVKKKEDIDRIDWEKSMLQVYKQEESMLQKNQMIGGTNGIKTIDLKEALEYQRMKMTEVLRKQVETTKSIKLAESRLVKVQQQLAEINTRNDRNTSEIMVQVSATKSIEAEMAICYLVKNAQWTPTYDIRVKNVSSPMEIIHKANITQQSGEDWKEVKLILSTGNPRESRTRPELQPWMLAYYVPPAIRIRELNGQPASNNLHEVVVVGYSSEDDNQDKASRKKDITRSASGVETKISYQPITTQYEIMVPYSVPNDGKVYTTEVQHHQVPANFEYYSAPKIDPAVFLTASISNWQELNLMPGETNLFFEGAFLGKSRLDPTIAGDTLSISLGQDKSIIIKRKLIRDFSAKKFLGNNKLESRLYDITIKNNKTEKISLTLEDQFPISTDKEIQVDQVQFKDGRLDDKTNKLTWNLELNPKEEVLRQIGYRIKYPREKTLQLD